MFCFFFEKKERTAERTMMEVNNELGGQSTDHTTDQKSPENEEVD